VTKSTTSGGDDSAIASLPLEDADDRRRGGVAAHPDKCATTAETAFEEYERLLAPARDRFAASAGVRAIQASEDGAFLEAFLFYFSIIGSTMTEPVEGWLLSASVRCAVLGLSDLSRALRGHARAEAGHHMMMIADARCLAARRPACNLPEVDVEQLLRQVPTGGALRYIKAHEANIEGAAPYAQVAIEYEVEMLPLRYGDAFVRHCVAVLGMGILPCLSFVTEHIVLDSGHTHFNATLIKRLLQILPDSMPMLVNAGTEILEAYAEFLEDCVKLARHDAAGLVDSRPELVGSLSWEMHEPPAKTNPKHSVPAWLAAVRKLRASVLFDNGRRPQFRTGAGCFDDNDPIDLHAHHIVVYDRAVPIGCVRVYRLAVAGPACVTEQVLGHGLFYEVLQQQGVEHTNTIEVGRWIVQPEHRRSGRTAIQLAAAGAALAECLGRSGSGQRNMVVCTVGMGDGQDLILSRIGMTTATQAQSVLCDDLNDEVRVMYTVSTDHLSSRFRQLMSEMAAVLCFKAQREKGSL
jgi:hypothetical protein